MKNLIQTDPECIKTDPKQKSDWIANTQVCLAVKIGCTFIHLITHRFIDVTAFLGILFVYFFNVHVKYLFINNTDRDQVIFYNYDRLQEKIAMFLYFHISFFLKYSCLRILMWPLANLLVLSIPVIILIIVFI